MEKKNHPKSGDKRPPQSMSQLQSPKKITGKVDSVSYKRTDSADHKHTLEALEKSLKELKDIKFALDQSAIVAVTDQKGIINYVNDMGCRQ